MDGRTLPGIIRQTPGGVGRNISDCLGKLQRSEGATKYSTHLISAVGDDQFGKFLLNSVNHLDTSGLEVNSKGRTACYCAFIDSKGDAQFGIGDMELHSTITPSRIMMSEDKIKKSSFIVVDGNIPDDSLHSVLRLSSDHSIPVWFEPTDILKASKPFKTELWKTIAFASPNMYELRAMAAAEGLKLDDDLQLNDTEKLLKQLTFLARPLVAHIPALMITMGHHGLLMFSRSREGDPSIGSIFGREPSELFARFYPSAPLRNITNSLGAGDCTAAGFIDGLIRGLTEPECVALGHLASKETLLSSTAVPSEFRSYSASRPSKASFHTISLN